MVPAAEGPVSTPLPVSSVRPTAPPRWLVRQGVERLDPGSGADQDLSALLIGPLRNSLAAQNARTPTASGPAPELRFSLVERDVPLDFAVDSLSSHSVLSAMIRTVEPAPTGAPVPPIATAPAAVVAPPRPGVLPVVAPTPPPVGLASPALIATTTRSYRATAQGEATLGTDGLAQFGVSTCWPDPGSANGPRWPADLTDRGIGSLAIGTPPNGSQQRTIEEVLGNLQLVVGVDKGATSGFKLIANLIWIGGVDEEAIAMLQSHQPMLSWNAVLGWKAQGGLS
jgi:hypothetical protein